MDVFDKVQMKAYVNKQTQYVEQQVNQAIFPEIVYQDLLTVDFSAPEFTSSIMFHSNSDFGEAEWINGNSNDIPRAGTERTKKVQEVHMAGIGYGWGWQEVNEAMAMGRNLQSEDAMAARRAYERMVDSITLVGDTSKGMEGILNHSKAGVTVAKTGDWNENTAPTAMVADINKLLSGVNAETGYQLPANTLLLPMSKLELAASMMMNDNMTVLQFINANNVYTATTGKPLKIRGLTKLETIGAGDTARMVAYHNSAEVVKLHIPMAHKFLPVFQSGALNFEVPGVFSIAGVDLRETSALRISDGI